MIVNIYCLLVWLVNCRYFGSLLVFLAVEAAVKGASLRVRLTTETFCVRCKCTLFLKRSYIWWAHFVQRTRYIISVVCCLAGHYLARCSQNSYTNSVIRCQLQLTNWLFLARMASRCRRAYILPRWFFHSLFVCSFVCFVYFFFLSSFFFSRRLMSEVTERISTKLGHILTYDCYLKNLVRTPPGIYTDFELWPNISLQRNTIWAIGKKLVNLQVSLTCLQI